MKTTSYIRRAGGAALLLLAPLAAYPSSIDDSAGRLVVPYVVQETGLASRVQLTNHEFTTTKARVFWVGDRSGPHPGRRTCLAASVPGRSMIAYDVRSQCSLSAAPDVGMLVLMVESSTPARLSARAIVDATSPTTGELLQTVSVAGLPLANLEGTESRLTASGLRSRGAGAPQALLTDCFVGSFFDGSATGGMLARVALESANGTPLGSKVTSLKPFELVRFKDVFASMGITSTMEGVQAEFAFTGKNDALVAYCVTAEEGMVKKDRSVVLSMGQAASPQDEVRRRAFGATGTPALRPFIMPGGSLATKQFHGVYVRHPDVVRCHVAMIPQHPQDPLLEIAAFSPDRVTTSGTSTSREEVEFATDARGAVNGGTADLWGLEVAYPSGATPPPNSVPYSIFCSSGNGTSLADLMFPQ
jgi:hypothetical protein